MRHPAGGDRAQTKHNRLERPCRRAAQIAQIRARRHAALTHQSAAQNGGYLRVAAGQRYRSLTAEVTDWHTGLTGRMIGFSSGTGASPIAWPTAMS
jgi:hypothetical protein